MRKIFLAFGLVGLGAMSASFAACSSSSGDDSTTPQDSGTDTSVTTDSGPVDSGPVDSGACATCSQLLTQGVTAGSPCAETTPILEAVLQCACVTTAITSGGEGVCDGVQADGGDAGNSSCSDLCANLTTVTPSTACLGCAQDNCSTELAACQLDGADGGTNTDAGDGGDGG